MIRTKISSITDLMIIQQFNIRTHRSGRAAAGKRKNRLRQTGRVRRASAVAAAEVQTAAAAVQMSAVAAAAVQMSAVAAAEVQTAAAVVQMSAAPAAVQAAAANVCGSAGRESEKKESGNAAS